MEKVFIALGSNLGDAPVHFQNARIALQSVGKNIRTSSLYLSKPYGFTEQNDFTNAVLVMETSLTPLELLSQLQKIEETEGKVFIRENGPRTLDLDIIFYGNEWIDLPLLKIPHPEAVHRDFVLAPIMELEADFVHPRENKTISELLEELENSFVYRICKVDGFGK